MTTKIGTISFTTISALALWDNEILGQLSDGAWENTAPHDHWEFWRDLEPALGAENKVTATETWRCRKTGYNLASLKQYILDRMLCIGRFARATGRLDHDRDATQLEGIQTFAAFKEAQASEGYRQIQLLKISDVEARKYFATEYTVRDLNADIKRIKQAMHSVQR